MTKAVKAFIETTEMTEKEYLDFQKPQEMRFASILSHFIYSGKLAEGQELYTKVKEAYPKELEEGIEQLKLAREEWAKEYS